ncbi:hypothetical protein L2E82_22956 [Cichorium intybus]|uniref:Uncharacterized protein n=1 Tax=Cichorium intybus TaxID=13427 RepID=A0ACB9DZH9_CICIN|nr:hypothetical protein L2E82_22956 [Cichorium intybus]
MVSVRCDSDQGRRNRAAGGSWLSPGAEKNGIVLGNLDPDSSSRNKGFALGYSTPKGLVSNVEIMDQEAVIDKISGLEKELGTVHLCRSVIRSIETARIFDFEEFPVRDKVTYMYYTGRLEVLNENFPYRERAEPNLRGQLWIHFDRLPLRIAAMILVWQYGEKSGYESWKGLSRSMLPLLLGGAFCACAWHFFYNSESLERVVVVTHGGVIRALGQRAYTGTGQRAGRILNVSVNVFHLLEPDQWEIKSWGMDEKLQEMKEFEEEGEKLMKLHEEKKAEMKSSHWKEEIDLEEGCNTDLMDKYTPKDKVQG